MRTSAWLTARCWRFGAIEREAGGIGSRAAFYAGYEAETPGLLDPGVVGYWEVLSAARWAVVALLQGERHLSGGETSLELNLTGMMAPEMEYEALRASRPWSEAVMADDAYATRALLELALTAYRQDLLGSLPASKRYLGAMVANALEIALRDLDDLVERSQTELLDALLPGWRHRGLAAAIRSGALPTDGQEAPCGRPCSATSKPS